MSRLAVSRFALPHVFGILTLAAAGSLVACADTDSASDVQNVDEITSGEFEVFLGDDDQHYFRLVANTGEKLLRSEGYTQKSSARIGIRSVKNNGVSVENYEVRKADDGQYYFNLVAQNGEIVAVSARLYGKRKQAEKAVATVKKVIAAMTKAEPKVLCGLKRLASTPQGEGEDFVDVTNLGEEEYRNSAGLDVFSASYSFDAYYYDENNIEILFYENLHVQDETGGLSCERPATLERGMTFCEEPIELDASLGTDEEERQVHAFDFSCRVE